MEIINYIQEIRTIAKNLKSTGIRLALVPTMGYLHEGHLSLITEAKKKADKVFVSIYVNPIQFGPKEDYGNYPRDLKRDFKLAESAGADFIFLPSDDDMYPSGYSTYVETAGVAEKFEGEKRPGHFKGVATVVAKLFNIIQPDIAVFGQKDYQQCLIISRMISDLNLDVELMVSPIVREENGLAKSSRNTYLTQAEREQASIIYKSLKVAGEAIKNGEKNRLKINAILYNSLRSLKSINIDYAESAIADSLEKPDNFLPEQNIILLVAAYLGNTRLIDNMLIKII
jgi:pantoate--beta-alanine ligase